MASYYSLYKIPTFKLIIVGDCKVGKTAFIKKHVTREFEKEYNATVGAVVYPKKMHTNHGVIMFDVWDTAGQGTHGDLQDGYYINADCAIIMFDTTSMSSYNNVATWYKDVIKVCGKIPLVLVGNKVDIDDRIVMPNMINFHRKNNLQYCDISVKKGFNFNTPFRWILRAVTAIKDLTIVKSMGTSPMIRLTDENKKKMIEEGEKGQPVW
jgi:GTP-binding nuclear protein Ran